MVKLTIYKIQVGKLIYIGSTWDLGNCIINHSKRYTNKINPSKLYQEIQDADLEFDDLIIKPLKQIRLKKLCDETRYKTQQSFIDKYNSVNNGLNDRNVYISENNKKSCNCNYSKKYYCKKKKDISIKAKAKYQEKKIFKIWENYDNLLHFPNM